MQLEGDLRNISLSKVLLAIGGQDGKGILTVQGDEDIVAVSFLDGDIVTADALNETVEEGLGRVLQSRGLVDPDDFRAVATEHQGGSSGSLADLLLQRGLIDRKQLLEALRIQTFRQMFKILAWRQGEYKFYSGDEISYEDGFQPISIEELLVRAIDKLGEKVGLLGPLPDLETVYRQVPPRGQIQILGRDGEGGVGIWISKKQASFLSKMDGQRHASEIASDQGLGKFAAVYSLYHLLQYDLVENVGRGSAPVFADDDLNATGSRTPTPTGRVGGVGSVNLDATGGVGGEPVFADEVLKVPEPLEPRPPRSPAPPPAAGRDPVTTDDTFGAALAEESMELERPLAAPSPVAKWIGGILATLLLLGLVSTLLNRPATVLLPFTWQDVSRSTAERQIRQSLYRRVDTAAKTFYLLEGKYPDSLPQMVERGLISPADLVDPAGYELVYQTGEGVYRISLEEDGERIEGLGTTEAITGDFLVDPQFLSTASEPPLVLLD
ncbi:MAG: DUF4388 domain-containing protein [Thermoanaerobaculia bacterium]|nr:DUF4388 domain-containing protein [Thermoanaerobaculia bacterium]